MEELLDNKQAMAKAYGFLGDISRIRQDLDQAEGLYKESLKLFMSIGSDHMIQIMRDISSPHLAFFIGAEKCEIHVLNVVFAATLNIKVLKHFSLVSKDLINVMIAAFKDEYLKPKNVLIQLKLSMIFV